MAKKLSDQQWANGFLQGVIWAANNPEMCGDIEPRPFQDERAREWIAANVASIESVYTGGDVATIETKEPGPHKELTPAEYRHKRGRFAVPPPKAAKAGK